MLTNYINFQNKALENKPKVLMLLSNPAKYDARPLKEARSLVKYGYNVTIYAWDRECRYPLNEIVDGILIQRIHLKSSYGNFMSIITVPIFWMLVSLRIFFEKFDIIHCHDFDTIVVGLIFNVIKKIPVVYDVHDLYYLRFQIKPLFISRVVQRFIQYLDILFSKKSSILITVTENLGQSHNGLKEYYLTSGVKNVITLWNTPTRSFFDNQKLQNINKFIIGYIGGQGTIDNFILLFEVVRELSSKNFKILFVGEGIKTKRLKRIVSTDYKDLDIEFIPNTPYSLIQQYYSICSVQYVVYDMKRLNDVLGVSVKIFESITMEKPVIVSKGGLEGDFVDLYQVGISVDYSIESIKKAIIDIQQHYDSYTNNCKKIKKLWNWEREERKLIEIYKTLE